MNDWAQLQRDLYKRIRQEIDSAIQTRPRELISYEKDFLKDQRGWKDSNHTELVHELNRADTAFIGDFHTLRQSQRLLLRLLRDKNIKKPRFLGFEILTVRSLALLRNWLRQPSSLRLETEIRRALQIETKWGSSWETFKEIFLYCQTAGIELLALQSAQASPRLHSRDVFASEQIRRISDRVWVFFGEYHCARTHLPKLVHRHRPQGRILVIQQNDDRAALSRLDRLSTTQTLVLLAPPYFPRTKKEAPIQLFCILHTPLWVKWQSYLEKYLKPGDVPPDEEFDAHDQITWSLQMLLEFLSDARYSFPLKKEELFDFDVYPPEDPRFYKSLAKLKPGVRQELFRELKSSNMAIVPETRRIYLAELTVNSCAQAAGSYLYRLCSKRISSRSEDFFKKIYAEAIAFFMSKILNHSRRARHWKDWAVLARRKDQRAREARMILRVKNLATLYPAHRAWLRSLRPFENEVIVSLGKMLADSLFEAFLVEEFSRPRLLRLLTNPPTTELDAFERIIEIQSVGRAFQPKSPKLW